MFILKLSTAGGLTWSVRVGLESTEYAYDIAYSGGYIYVVGSTNSLTWTSANTDMVYLRLKNVDGSLDYIYSVGGT